MKQIEINPSFIKGFECGTKAQFEADKEVICRIKVARDSKSIADFLAIIDKMIAESEGKE